MEGTPLTYTGVTRPRRRSLYNKEYGIQKSGMLVVVNEYNGIPKVILKKGKHNAPFKFISMTPMEFHDMLESSELIKEMIAECSKVINKHNGRINYSMYDEEKDPKQYLPQSKFSQNIYKTIDSLRKVEQGTDGYEDEGEEDSRRRRNRKRKRDDSERRRRADSDPGSDVSDNTEN